MYLLPAGTIRTRIDELLQLLGLSGDESKLTLEYSHGMIPTSPTRPRARAATG
jgi:ABC-2 type transport system ATP-binding protein